MEVPGNSLAFGFAGVDYCLLSNHGCEYSCINTDRSFACQCPEGHVLRSDGKTCASESQQVCSPRTNRTWHRCPVGVRVLPPCACALVSSLGCYWACVNDVSAFLSHQSPGDYFSFCPSSSFPQSLKRLFLFPQSAALKLNRTPVLNRAATI
jgi:hypothetical protein